MTDTQKQDTDTVSNAAHGAADGSAVTTPGGMTAPSEGTLSEGAAGTAGAATETASEPDLQARPPQPPPAPPEEALPALAAAKAQREAENFDALLHRHPLPTWRPIAWVVMALLTTFLIWAAWSELDEVTVATGEVVPQSRVKVIQHLEGGIISDLFVEEGATVSVGTELLRLELPTTAINREELEIRLDGLRLARARLQAQVELGEIDFPLDVADRRPTLVLSERRAHQARLSELESTLVVLENQRLQKEHEIEELEAKLDAASSSLEIAEERFDISDSLLRDGLTHRLAHLDIQAQIESFRGEIDSLGPGVQRAKASLEEIRSREREMLVSFQREGLEMLNEVELDIARTREMLDMANSQQVRATIRSPDRGVIKNIKYTTIGAVVTPGDPIMELVPLDDALVVEARLNPIDRGYVHDGLPATVKISTFDYARYGGLDGVVEQVAPDTTVDERGMAYYRVRVRTDRSYLGEEAGQFAIAPGMEATVDIHTGTRTVLDYLVRPVLKLRHEAFRER